jgi:hypothetical protein
MTQPEKTIGRREVLRSGGVAALAVAGVAVVPFAAKAETEDRELLDLWQQWKEAKTSLEVTVKEHGRVEGLVWDATAPWWMLKHFPTPYVATFERSIEGKPITMQLPIEAETWNEAYDIAKAKQAEFDAERQRTQRAARRKYKWGAIERATNAAHNRLGDLERQIGVAKANGIDGVLVKLALAEWLCRSGLLSAGEERDAGLIRSSYSAVVRLASGRDLTGDVAHW